MPTIGEKDYNSGVTGKTEVGDTEVEWRVTSTSVFYDPTFTAYFVEIACAVQGSGEYSLRLQVDSDSPDVANVVDEASGLIDELVYLRARGVVRKNAKSKHRTLIGVV